MTLLISKDNIRCLKIIITEAEQPGIAEWYVDILIEALILYSSAVYAPNA
jgi:hypothetical protein